MSPVAMCVMRSSTSFLAPSWVLTVPFELRLLLAAKPEALSAIGLIFVQEIQRWRREQARALGYERPETAAVSFCQRFGSSLNLNIHWHVIVRDAVFLPDASGERVDTLKHRAPTRLDLEEIVTTVAIRWLESFSRALRRWCLAPMQNRSPRRTPPAHSAHRDHSFRVIVIAPGGVIRVGAKRRSGFPVGFSSWGSARPEYAA